MDSLAKQMRVRFSGQGANSPRERRLPLQKTQSFKGAERKNWFQRQFSGQMSQDKDSTSDIEFAAMVAAAAAFAINSLEEEEEGLRDQKRTGEVLEIHLTSKSRKEEGNSIVSTDPGRVSRRFSDMEIKEDKPTPGKDPTIKKAPTFADPKPSGTTFKKLGTTEDTRPTGGKTTLSTSTGDGPANSQARAWEEAEMARIKKRYEKMNSTILSWENEKKVKAKRRTERIESQLDKRRARALQSYRIKISKIDQVAGGARSLAEERKRNEETKTKDKARKIRSTGKVPVTCFCF